MMKIDRKGIARVSILSNRRTQAGVSLISLMIGLFISMLCVLSSLTLYKNLVHVSAEAKIDTLHDGQLAGAFLTLQLEIQSAGYQIVNAGANDVVTRDNSGNRELFWRYNDGGFQCRGLIESSAEIGGITYRVLNLVRVNTGCDGATALTSMDWGTVVSTLGRWPVREGLAAYMNGRASMLDISIDPVACSPYGAVIPEEHLMVTISGPSSSRVHAGVAGAMTTFQYCLLNT